MVEFSKMMARGKHANPGKGKPNRTGDGGLSLRKLSLRQRDQMRAERKEDTQEGPDTVEKRKVLYTQAAEYLGMAFSSVQADKLFSLQPGFKILEKIVDTRAPIDALFLKAIHEEESYDLMVSPSINVAIYAIKMAENLGFSKTRQVEIGMVGLLHDIGMAKIPKELIYKQNLTDDEFLIFKERPKYGFDILQAFNKDYAYLAECTLQIHERADGSGYPLGLTADEIHEYAQIIGLVDIYEALIHARPQREKILHFYAVKEIIKTGKDKFQQRFLKALLNTFSIFPLNSYVRLNSGAIGRVTRTYPDQPMRPKVQIIYDSQNKRVLTERFINLPEHSLLYITDSVSEQELIELSEASYLVTKPGRSQHAPVETDVESDTHPEIDAPEEEKANVGKPVTRLTEARATKPGSTLLKKSLLALAVLFFVAGVAWQFFAGMPVNGNDQGVVETTTRDPENLKAQRSEGKTAQSERAKPSEELPLKQPVTTEGIEPGQSVVEKVNHSEQASSQEMIRVEDEKQSVSPKAPVELKAVATTEISKQPINENKITPSENQPKEISPPATGRYPYSILLSSYKNLRRAEAAIAEYQKKGLGPFWVKVDLGAKGTWFRVFNGNYADNAQARTAIEEFRLEGAMVKHTRYANWVAGFTDNQALTLRRSELADKGFSTYVMADGMGNSQLYVGAFLTAEGVQDQYASLKSAGVESKIVER